MIPYDYEMELKLRVIKAILGIGDDTTRELWRETMLVLNDQLSDGPRLTENDDDTQRRT